MGTMNGIRLRLAFQIFLAAVIQPGGQIAVAQTASPASSTQLESPSLTPLTREQILNLRVAPEADYDREGEQTLEDMFLKRSAIDTMTIRGYKTCRDINSGRLMIACGARACPGGTEMVAWSPEAHPDCNANDACVDMKSLGWTHGHKNRFCISRGYDGVRPYSGKYSNGGRCFKGNGCD